MTMCRNVLCLALGTLLLSACGKSADLTPRAGASLPPAPYGARESLSAEQMMEPSTQARPVSEVELLRRSERREVDPFDLPPGYVAPAADAATPHP